MHDNIDFHNIALDETKEIQSFTNS
uniref:Uncharacterized protein n=1 Tax=Arundo donax TaxID=35708 RepID=A0A0A9G7V7_ARUDO